MAEPKSPSIPHGFRGCKPKLQTSGGVLVLITTADVEGGRDKELARLVHSIERFRAASPDVVLRHYMLLQRCDDPAAGRARFDFPDWMTITAVPIRLSLSAARNRIIDDVLVDGVSLADAVIAFPDDDAWFPDGVLEYISRRFINDSELDFWFCRYGTAACLPDRIEERTPSLGQAIARASSNSIVVRGRLLEAVGGFDEGLGLGTPARSGEDTEFAIRSFFAARKVRFAPHVMIGHRDFDALIRANYYGGTLVALGRHGSRTVSARLTLARKLLVGVALTLKGDLSPAAFRDALGMWRANRVAPNAAAISDRPSGIRLD